MFTNAMNKYTFNRLFLFMCIASDFRLGNLIDFPISPERTDAFGWNPFCVAVPFSSIHSDDSLMRCWNGTFESTKSLYVIKSMFSRNGRNAEI